MARIGTRLLTLTIDGVERSAELSKFVISADDTDSDFVSFADARAGGGKDYKMVMTAAQNYSADTLADLMWDRAGETVTYVCKPSGQSGAASATEPTFSGSVVIGAPQGDIIGGEADASTSAVFTMDFEWKLTGKPTRNYS